MKKQIRRGVFETNSSSVHSLTMCSSDEYEKWEIGELLYWEDKDKFVSREEAIKELQEKKSWDGSLMHPYVDWNDEEVVDGIFEEERIKTSEEFFNDDWYETFEQSYTTPKGEEIVAFGYYGHD